MRPQSKIVECHGYMLGALNYPKAYRYDSTTGDWYAMHTDGRIFNCHPQHADGNWPIRFEKREYDEDIQAVRALFE